MDELICRSRQNFNLEGELLSKSLHFRTSLSSARNGKHQCTLTLLTFRKLLTASSERDWDIMGQYGIPSIFIRTFKALYHQSSSCVTEGGRYSSWFEVKSGERQGCVLSGFIFVLIMDWVMSHTNDKRRGLRWKFTLVLEDLDYADGVALISSRFADLQQKTDRLAATAGIVGLKINTCKTKMLRMNHRCTDYIRIDGGGRCGILRVPRFST